MNEKQTRLYECLFVTGMTRQASLSYKTVTDLLVHFPGLDQLTGASGRDLAEIVRGPQEKISRLSTLLKDERWRQDLQKQAIQADQQGIWAVFCLDADYPERLRDINGKPLILYCRGDPERYAEIFSRPFSVTVIGTRNPTAYGKTVAEKITAELAESRVVIVSGLARGIDAIAHRTALQKRGLTLAVLGNGPDLTYPPENTDLMEKIIKAGLIVSEHPPGTVPLRQHFPARNRILSGLADAVAVIEASSRSGTLITAGYAGEQGRDVYAVPGNILSPFSQGCNQLIREGAGVLESAADILWRLPGGGLQARIEQWLHNHPDDIESGPARNRTTDSSQAGRLCQLLSGGSLSQMEIASQMEMSMPDTAILLTQMELVGSLHCEKGRYSLTERQIFCI